MLSMLYVRLTIKAKVGIPESLKVGWYPHEITVLSHLKSGISLNQERIKGTEKASPIHTLFHR